MIIIEVQTVPQTQHLKSSGKTVNCQHFPFELRWKSSAENDLLPWDIVIINFVSIRIILIIIDCFFIVIDMGIRLRTLKEQVPK